MPDVVRTFIALPVSSQVTGSAAAIQQELSDAGGRARWVEAEHMHLTLLFLGDVDLRDVHRLGREVGEVARDFGPIGVTFKGVGAFPTVRRPRAVWVGVTDGVGELRRLHAALEGPLMAAGHYRREDREYSPHLTLGRVQGEADGAAMAALLPKHAGRHAGRMTAGEVQVVGSELTKRGPVYSILSSAPLRKAC